MTDRDDRDRESRDTDETRYEREREAEERRRHELAQQLRRDLPSGRDDASDRPDA